MKLAWPGPRTFVCFLAVFGTHMLATTKRMIRTGGVAHEINRADDGPGPLTSVSFCPFQNTHIGDYDKNDNER